MGQGTFRGPIRVVAGSAICLLVGCGAGQAGAKHTPSAAMAPSHTPTGKTPAGYAILRGRVVRPPGRDPRSGARAAVVPVNGDPIRARDAHGTTVATAVTKAGGEFRLRLRPGTYDIGEDICAVIRRVDIPATAPVSVTLTLPRTCNS